MSDAVKIDGLPEYAAEPVQAYRGAGDRVHLTTTKALDDAASNGLAREFPDQMSLNRPFNEIISHATDNLEWWERVMILARWRKANGLGSRK